MGINNKLKDKRTLAFLTKHVTNIRITTKISNKVQSNKYNGKQEGGTTRHKNLE